MAFIVSSQNVTTVSEFQLKILFFQTKKNALGLVYNVIAFLNFLCKQRKKILMFFFHDILL